MKTIIKRGIVSLQSKNYLRVFGKELRKNV